VKLRRLIIPLCCLVLLAVACSGGDDDNESADADADAGGEAAGGDGGESDGGGTPSEGLEIETELGPVRGADSGVEGVRSFLALPYAAPPTGENRWRPPQPREPYEGTFDATQPGPSCPQNVGGSTARFTVIPDPDEDCLSLDVWSPDGAADLPVMVWYHGGGLRAGSAHQPYYQGDDIASESVVVVGVNYRLGPLGFLATEALAGESDDGAFGNYGLADQTAALEWVQENAAAFGGDPDNVTIFGESAGGGSVCAHLASTASEGLFHKAIIQSGGGCNRGFAVEQGERAQAQGAAFMEAVGCADMACLRELPTDQLLAQDFQGGFVFDGVTLPESGRDRAEQGELDDIPVIIGSNAEEAVLLTASRPLPGTEAELRDLVAELTDDPDALLALYPAADYETTADRYYAIFTDVRFTCPVVAFGEAATGEVYLYHYTYRSDRFPVPTHGVELALVFAHPEGITDQQPGLDGTDAEVSAAMQSAWVDFATGGDPGEGWEPYSEQGRMTRIDSPVELVDEVSGGRCAEVTGLSDVPPGS
jgi:para-nitrobenzyl esterase